MAWPLRVNVAGGWYHVFARGLGGMRIFWDDRDREHLLELLEATVARYGVEIHAFGLMETHFHLVVRTPEPNLSRAMQWLNQSYAAWFNARQGRVGPVFQRPFGSVVVENGAWAYELRRPAHIASGRAQPPRWNTWCHPSRTALRRGLAMLRTLP